jgi:hypothetical protein
LHCGELLVRAFAQGRQFLHVVREHGAPRGKLVDLGDSQPEDILLLGQMPARHQPIA